MAPKNDDKKACRRIIVYPFRVPPSRKKLGGISEGRNSSSNPPSAPAVRTIRSCDIQARSLGISAFPWRPMFLDRETTQESSAARAVAANRPSAISAISPGSILCFLYFYPKFIRNFYGLFFSLWDVVLKQSPFRKASGTESKGQPFRCVAELSMFRSFRRGLRG